MTRWVPFLAVVLTAFVPAAARAGVKTVRVPGGGEVPEVVLDAKGTLHMTYGRGLPGNAYYAQSRDGGKTFSEPVRINRHADTVTTGGERGPKLAVGKDGVLHVLWLGYYKQGGGAWYTRSTDGGKTFAEECNLVEPRYGVDNAVVAADDQGNVVALWTGGFPGVKEDSKSPVASPIILVRSTDNGRTFSKNERLHSDSPVPGRSCGCCRLNAQVRGDTLYVAFRAGYLNVRDPYLLRGPKTGNDFQCVRVSVDDWETACPMQGIPVRVGGKGRVLVSWMSRDRAYWTFSDDGGKNFHKPIAVRGAGREQAHPLAVSNKKGEVLLVWKQGEQVLWVLYRADGKYTGQRGKAGELPGRNKPTAFVGRDDNFYVVF